jgi:hypothetical protein
MKARHRYPITCYYNAWDLLHCTSDKLAPLHLTNTPVLPTERIAHLSYGRGLLRCGISIRPPPRSGFGHLQNFGTAPGLPHNRRKADTSAAARQRVRASAILRNGLMECL